MYRSQDIEGPVLSGGAWERGGYTANTGRMLKSLVPRPLPRKAERGSGVLSNISCHMGRGLWDKDCHIYILHPGLDFSDDLDCCTVLGLQRLDKAVRFLGKAENELRIKFFYLHAIRFKIQSLTSCTYV